MLTNTVPPETSTLNEAMVRVNYSTIKCVVHVSDIHYLFIQIHQIFLQAIVAGSVATLEYGLVSPADI